MYITYKTDMMMLKSQKLPNISQLRFLVWRENSISFFRIQQLTGNCSTWLSDGSCRTLQNHVEPSLAFFCWRDSWNSTEYMSPPILTGQGKVYCVRLAQRNAIPMVVHSSGFAYSNKSHEDGIELTLVLDHMLGWRVTLLVIRVHKFMMNQEVHSES